MRNQDEELEHEANVEVEGAKHVKGVEEFS
jgi:hypothetical protein